MQLTPLSRRRIFAGATAMGLVALIVLFAIDSPTKADPPTSGTSVVLISGDGMGIQQRTAIQYATYGLDERQPMDALPYRRLPRHDPGDARRERLRGRARPHGRSG